MVTCEMASIFFCPKVFLKTVYAKGPGIPTIQHAICPRFDTGKGGLKKGYKRNCNIIFT